jgi:hypothetical protein
MTESRSLEPGMMNGWGLTREKPDESQALGEIFYMHCGGG